MRRCALLAVALLASGAQGAPGLGWTPSVATLALTATPSVPVHLDPGPQGATTVSVTHTGALSNVTGGLTSTAFNTTFLNNTAANAWQLRLVVRATNNIGDCMVCDLEFRRGSTTSSQVQVRNGAVTQSQGPWHTVGAAGSGTHAWHLYAVGQRTLVADKVANVTVQLEIAPVGASVATAVYWNMTTMFRV